MYFLYIFYLHVGYNPYFLEISTASLLSHFHTKLSANYSADPLCGNKSICVCVFTNCIVDFPVIGSKSAT